MKKYEENMEKYVGKWRIWRNMKEYEEMWKKYEEIWRNFEEIWRKYEAYEGNMKELWRNMKNMKEIWSNSEFYQVPESI